MQKEEMQEEQMQKEEMRKKEMEKEEMEQNAAQSVEQESPDVPSGTRKDETEAAQEEAADGADGDTGRDEAESGEAAGSKKGFFKKNKKKDKKDEKIEELTDQVKRQMAEFDNFRKRTDKEKAQMYEIGAKSIIEKVLPVVDNFERGLAAVPEESKEDAFVDGMNKIYKQLMTMLEEADVKPIEAVGKEFDPNLHNAVMQTESEEYESGIVAQELQKGYTYRDSVVRHSMVAVVS
ncbi:MAG: nucleotide exchange factor GrpE [Eubacterium sp.]|nr:nucleotide exchange factor GrpE [Eubacterium sp.]